MTYNGIFVKNFDLSNTIEQYNQVINKAKSLFINKNKDYGPTWRVLRPSSLTDQLYIKAARIRSLEIKGNQLVEDSISDEYMALVNYGIMSIIQLERGVLENIDEVDSKRVEEEYNFTIHETRDLFVAKNHDYGEAWRMMRISSFTDLILVKLLRIKQMEQNNGQTIVSEGPKSNYQDIINYAVFGLIKLSEIGKFKIT